MKSLRTRRTDSPAGTPRPRLDVSPAPHDRLPDLADRRREARLFAQLMDARRRHADTSAELGARDELLEVDARRHGS